MAIAKAYNLKQAYQMITSGKQTEVELAFDVDADAFFMLSANYGDSGAKITRHNNHFVLRLDQEEASASD
ncbi:hypothetical protein Y71_11230 [Kosakonia radicincitans DSM 16656]|uniref:Uncharacterized protein n=1 Tax=Kosakonia radicincitans TaxID=283686 RepID=A0AAX2ERD0_9ENTR|nr:MULTISPECIES: hypothetical protein [Kosakonia]MDP9567450.1 hypothetical protein [Kosakonia oryzae]APG18446.1 hypothetical protein A3780_13080 [Kosakonia radicincitans]ARD60464.1 hypothetical protein Y71_11230 [Kosakonia radicincitans DSM 16656]KDE35011.1 hypothetical protein AW40_19275 [Kosakonia radicincitans UMEnt01/12]MDD7997680.1 hypothetical protein [Kosakonia radicincitans]